MKQQKKYIPTEYEREVFIKTLSLFDNDIIYDSVIERIMNISVSLLSDMETNGSFLIHLIPENSIQDVRLLFDEIVENWISDNLIDESDMTRFNMFTDFNVELSVKEDIFRHIISSSKMADKLNDSDNEDYITGNYIKKMVLAAQIQSEEDELKRRKYMVFNRY
jgi:hypothetical protein